MKASNRLALTFLAASAIAAAFAGKPPSCTDYTLSWTIDDSDPNRAIGSDNLGAYAGTGYICNGGNDATVNTGNSPAATRHIYLNFTNLLSQPTACTPVDRFQPLGGNFLNVQDLFNNYDRNADYTFATTMMGYIGLGGEGYTLRLNPNNPVANAPYMTSWVNVQHFAGADERFEVTPLPSPSPGAAGQPVASLMKVEKKTTTNCGQAASPFKFIIRVVR